MASPSPDPEAPDSDEEHPSFNSDDAAQCADITLAPGHPLNSAATFSVSQAPAQATSIAADPPVVPTEVAAPSVPVQ